MFVTRDIQLANGIEMRVMDSLRALSTFQSPPDVVAGRALRRLDPRSDCTVLPSSGQALFRRVGRSTLLGVDVVEVADDAGHYWMAPAYGCEVLKQIVHRRDSNGQIRDTSERVVVSFRAGEPDAALFYVDRDYAEVSPKDMLQRECALRNCGGADRSRSLRDPHLERLEQQYRDMRPSEAYFEQRRANRPE